LELIEKYNKQEAFYLKRFARLQILLDRNDIIQAKALLSLYLEGIEIEQEEVIILERKPLSELVKEPEFQEKLQTELNKLNESDN